MTGFVLFAFALTGVTTVYFAGRMILDSHNLWFPPVLIMPLGFAMVLAGVFQIYFVLWSLF